MDASEKGRLMVHGELAVWRRTPAWLREVLLLAALYGVYELIRAFADVNPAIAVENARNLMHVQADLHLRPEGALNHAITNIPAIAVPACYLYAVCHYVVTPTVLLWLWHAHRRDYGRARSILVAATLLGLLGFWLAPMAPPRTFAGFTDTMAEWSHYGWWGGAGSVPSGFQGFTNQFAAMPSLHVGWAVWCGWAIWRYASRRWVKALGVAYPILTWLVVMGTANHYFLDAVAGTAVIALSGALVVGAEVAWVRLAADRMVRAAAGPNRPAARNLCDRVDSR